MSATEDTTYTWACDLCGSAAGKTMSRYSPPDGLTRIEIIDKQQSRGPGYATVTADVCADCMQRPIADLADFTDRKFLDQNGPTAMVRVRSS